MNEPQQPSPDNLATVPNPHPPNAIPKRRRLAYDPIPQVNPKVNMTPEEWWELQNEKQARHGAAVAKMLKGREAEKKRQEMLLKRGMPQINSPAQAIQDAVNAGFDQNSIPTKGNT